MNFEQILALLTAKHAGARKDVLANIARNIAMVADSDETVNKLVEGITPDKASAFSKEFRSGIDREVTEANKKAEENLRSKYDFVEKGGKKDEPNTPIANPEIAELTKQVQALTGLVSGFATERVASSRKAEIEEVLKQVKDQSYKDMILSNFGFMNFDDDAKFASYKEDLAAKVAEKVQQQADEGLANTGRRVNFGQADSNGVSSGVAAFVKEQAADNAEGLGGKSL